jgi:hypothetical protein
VTVSPGRDVHLWRCVRFEDEVHEVWGWKHLPQQLAVWLWLCANVVHPHACATCMLNLQGICLLSFKEASRMVCGLTRVYHAHSLLPALELHRQTCLQALRCIHNSLQLQALCCLHKHFTPVQLVPEFYKHVLQLFFQSLSHQGTASIQVHTT